MKILILCPSFERLGGVANHFNGLKDKFSVEVSYFFIGGYNKKNPLTLMHEFFQNLIRFRKEIKKNQYDIIHLNPSLDKYAIARDFVFLFICKNKNVKTIFFIHGWNTSFENLIDKYCKNIFIYFLNYSDTVLVLASEFKQKLLKWGCRAKIELSTTKVDDNLLLNFNILKKKQNKSILFLARIEEVKGVKIAIDAVNLLNSREFGVQLRIVGHGSYLEEINRYVYINKIENVSFMGNLSGVKLASEFELSSIYLFPTYHGEGMPTSVLEAMAFGLPVITRPVGGIKDFFEDGKMGYVTESKDPKVFAELIQKLLDNPEKLRAISEYNHKYAKEHFLASKVAKKLEEIYMSII